MPRYEYETVQLQTAFWTSAPKGLEEMLNEYAAKGWRLCQILTPAHNSMAGYHVVLEREVA
jgi:hypothetical protein